MTDCMDGFERRVHNMYMYIGRVPYCILELVVLLHDMYMSHVDTDSGTESVG